MKRPVELACRSQQMLASIIGLRGKAIATPVPSWIRCVSRAATTRGKNGSWLVSALHSPSNPISSARRAVWAAASNVVEKNVVSTLIGPPFRGLWPIAYGLWQELYAHLAGCDCPTGLGSIERTQ